MSWASSKSKSWLNSLVLVVFLFICIDSNKTAQANIFTNLIRDWKDFSSYPSLARASRALSQGRYSDAEREARFVLNQIDTNSHQARLILAEALLAQRRYGNALDALQMSIEEPLYRQIQLIWLNQSTPVPEYRVEQWLQQHSSGLHRESLIKARSEQLKRLYGAKKAWDWLRKRGGDVVYRSGLAELAHDWLAIVEELSLLAQNDSELSPLLQQRLSFARATLNQQPLNSTNRRELPINNLPTLPPPPTLDELSFNLVASGNLQQALELLEKRLVEDYSPVSLIPKSLANRLINLYAQLGAPKASFLKLLSTRLPVYERGVLFEQLASSGDCAILPEMSILSSETASAGEWLAYGQCAIQQTPGEASVYLDQALLLGREDSRSLLAFALAASGEPERAYELFESLPSTEKNQSSIQAGMAQVSLQLNQLENANEHWQRLTEKSVDNWRLGALIAAKRGELFSAYERYEIVLYESQNASDFYQGALIARDIGNSDKALEWFGKANELDPNNFRYLSDYGFTLRQDPRQKIQDQALPVLLRASQISDEKPEIEAEIAKLFKERRDYHSSLKHYKRAIRLEQDALSSTEPLTLPSQHQRLYGLKRNFEFLSRNDRLQIDFTISPYGSAQSIDDLLIDDVLLEYQQGIVGTLKYERRLSDQDIFSYTRFIASSSLSQPDFQSSGGFGFRYKPFYDLNINLFAEYFQSRLADLSSDDALLRINGSVLDQGDWSAEWKADRDVWNERFFYFDSAYFVQQSQLIGLYRYSQGRTWKLPGDVAQTLSPYFFSQMAHQDYEYDLRIGIGLRWQIWLNEDELRAFRHKLTTRLEYQQPLSGDLYQQTPGVRFSFQIDL
ncbi:bacteriophage N4 receptor, outer membrane subunit [Synechococcus sp. MIT S9509]|uniref:NfrA family protein n=1 Tax=unclassified Synechococcus TaxID=2626047 RepID=UPI0007BBCF8C|nr:MULTISPECIES: hypothetical protein [unclassified Synechococcus]KZR84940.1 bacteriophage N4 receptor, outer membrane subunit [Synechococcus sp. MIT S9504]KZR90119.1 bacteriophage N4 receptor, outer membrane subunit [Synechococcus sp. MIT S9509]